MSKPQPIVFFGTPEFAVSILEALVSAGHEIRAVITEQPAPQGRGHKLQPQPVDVWASAHGLPVWRPQKLKDEKFLRDLAALDCPLFVLAAYGRILPQAILTIPPNGVVNVHPSLLPRYRGPAPIVTALRQGDAETGVSIMLLDQGMDTGPLLTQEKTAITADDTTTTLSERLAQQGAALLVQTLKGYGNGSLTPKPQPATAEAPTRFITKDDGRADWRRPARELERDSRAFTPWPNLWTTWENKPLKILRAKIIASTPGSPGQVAIVDGQPAIATGDGALLLERLQPAGGRVMPAADFLRGHPAFASARLG
jgi:methionyl-tRNA formyltransferase